MAGSSRKPPRPVRIPSFGRLLGYRIVEASAERGVVEMRIRPEHLNRSGVVHGGVMMTLIDVACSVAGTYTPPGVPPKLSASVSITTSFLGNVDRGVLRATGWRIGGGTRLYFARAEIRDGGGNLVAHGEGVFRYRSPEATAVAVSRARAARRRAASSRSGR
jgi:uncharacterized protein (TIGR00369 family)